MHLRPCQWCSYRSCIKRTRMRNKDDFEREWRLLQWWQWLCTLYMMIVGCGIKFLTYVNFVLWGLCLGLGLGRLYLGFLPYLLSDFFIFCMPKIVRSVPLGIREEFSNFENLCKLLFVFDSSLGGDLHCILSHISRFILLVIACGFFHLGFHF